MVYRIADINQLKKDLAACQALIQLMEDLGNKARPRMSQKEIERYEKWMEELRKEKSLLMDAILRLAENYSSPIYSTLAH